MAGCSKTRRGIYAVRPLRWLDLCKTTSVACLPVWLALVQGSCVSLHTLLLAVCLQLLLAFVACIGAGLMCEPAHVAARCVLAAVACLCGLHWCRAHV